MNSDDFVDFDSFEDENEKSIEITFDKRTSEYYRILRFRKMDPIMCIELDDNKCFKFNNKWDPYTGERLDEDKDGPLCFHPDFLIHYFYTKRLNNLWVNSVDHVNYHYQGYYDIAVGAGEDIYIESRGYCPDKYLFRLPINDCYLTNDHNQNIITMGPKLTDSEIQQIDKLAELYGNNYKNIFGRNRPSLKLMKYYYDQAISKTPDLQGTDISNLSCSELQSIREKYNRIYVDSLKKIK